MGRCSFNRGGKTVGEGGRVGRLVLRGLYLREKLSGWRKRDFYDFGMG